MFVCGHTGAHYKNVRQHRVTEVHQGHERQPGGDDADLGREGGDGSTDCGDDGQPCRGLDERRTAGDEARKPQDHQDRSVLLLRQHDQARVDDEVSGNDALSL